MAKPPSIHHVSVVTWRVRAIAVRKPKGAGAPPVSEDPDQRLIETSAGVGEHRIDLAGVRGEIGAAGGAVAVGAGHLGQQLLEIGDVAVDGGAELVVALIFLADLVEGLLALQGIEPPGEEVLLAATVTLPKLDRRIMVDGPRDIERERAERRAADIGRCGRSGRPVCGAVAARLGFDVDRLGRRRRGGIVAASFIVARSPAKQVGHPATLLAAFAAWAPLCSGGSRRLGRDGDARRRRTDPHRFAGGADRCRAHVDPRAAIG